MTQRLLLDYIYIRPSKSLNKNKIKTGVLFYEISDHLPIFLLMSKMQKNAIERKCIRIYGEKQNNTNFKIAMQQVDWTEVVECDDVDASYAKIYPNFNSKF